jgi:hypothetical protein
MEYPFVRGWKCNMKNNATIEGPAELADRIEAEAPGRELDTAIAVAIKLDCRPNLRDDLEYLSLPNKHDPGPGVTAGHYWFHCRSGMILRTALPYTTSIDAAMTLVPEGMNVRLRWEPNCGFASTGYARAQIYTGTHFEIAETDNLVTAICAVALRAHAQAPTDATWHHLPAHQPEGSRNRS